MKTQLALCVLAITLGPLTFAGHASAQDSAGGRPVGQLSVFKPASRAAAPVSSEKPEEPAAAAAPPAEPAAVAETPAAAAAPAARRMPEGPREFSPIAITQLVMTTCPSAARSGDLVAVAAGRGLGEPQPPPADLLRTLPPDVRTWQAPVADGELHLFGYSEPPMTCGAAVLHAVPGAAFDKSVELLLAAGDGFTVDSSETSDNGRRWTRLKSPAGAFLDVMEYPASGARPPVLRIDYLPK